MIGNSRSSTLSDDFLAVAHGIRELHRLALEGKDESLEADLVRDAADLPWAALTEAERKRARGLSADLYSISETPTADERIANPQAQSKLIEAYKAEQRGQWDKVLEIIRRWETHLAPSIVSSLRGSAWMQAGDLEAAALFWENALLLDPANDAYTKDYIRILIRLDPEKARRFVERVLAASGGRSPELVVYASSAEFNSITTLSGQDSFERIRRLIPILSDALTRIQAESPSEDDGARAAHSMAATLQGLCHEILGEEQKARECCD